MTRRSQFKIPKIPEMTVRRLSVYTRCLLQLEEDGVKTISSQELAERFSLNSAQVRKDLAYFGLVVAAVPLTLRHPSRLPESTRRTFSLWNVLDTTPEGRGADWYPKLNYRA